MRQNDYNVRFIEMRVREVSGLVERFLRIINFYFFQQIFFFFHSIFQHEVDLIDQESRIMCVGKKKLI